MVEEKDQALKSLFPYIPQSICYIRTRDSPGPERRDWCWPAERHERLDEGEDEGGQTEDGVGVDHDGSQAVGPAASVEDDEDDPGDGSGPDHEHEEPVPEEPLSLATTLPGICERGTLS